MVDFFLFKKRLKEVWCTLLKLVWIDKGSPNMLKGDSPLLAGVVVRVSILRTLSDVVTRLFAPFADIALG